MKKEVLNIVGDVIRQNLGRLDDIPHELANTVANVYYRFFLLALEAHEAKDHASWVPLQIKRSPDFITGLKDFINKYPQIIGDFDAINEHIKALRQVDRIRKPNTYSFLVEYLLDEYKYNIKNAGNKPEILRKIERKFKKIGEIPNLVDLLDV